MTDAPVDDAFTILCSDCRETIMEDDLDDIYVKIICDGCGCRVYIPNSRIRSMLEQPLQND